MTNEVYGKINDMERSLSKDISKLGGIINTLSVNVAQQTTMINGHKEVVDLHVKSIKAFNGELSKRLAKQEDKVESLEKDRDNIKGSLATAKWFWGAMWTVGMALVGAVSYVMGG